MKISSREVEYVAHLARLEITDAEKEKFTAQLNDILLYIDKLNELDTGDVKPCLLYTSQSPRDRTRTRMPSSA